MLQILPGFDNKHLKRLALLVWLLVQAGSESWCSSHLASCAVIFLFSFSILTFTLSGLVYFSVTSVSGQSAMA